MDSGLRRNDEFPSGSLECKFPWLEDGTALKD